MNIPTPEELIGTTSSGSNPETLCLNWRTGCNVVTEGPQNGKLSRCYDCQCEHEHEQHALRIERDNPTHTMDPNACLQRIRDAYPIIDAVDTANHIDDIAILENAVQAARDLDEWLSKGGFLPQPWQRQSGMLHVDEID